MPADIHSPITGQNFILRVNSYIDIPLKSIGEFTERKEYDYIQQGGVNDYVTLREKPQSQPFSFTAERYLLFGQKDYLPLGEEFKLPMLLMVSKVPGRFVMKNIIQLYSFFGATVISKTYGGMDAERAGILVQKIEIAYQAMKPMDL